MKKSAILVVGLLLLFILSCSKEEFNKEIEIPDFNFPKTIVFEDSLSAYNIFKGNPANLTPSDEFELLELSSILFTDYAYKQRLVKIPIGKQMTRLNDGSIDFPNGTILTKTFFYYKDERDISLGKRIIETRLLIKENNTWNIATYLWNQNHTHAILELNGIDTQVSWINSNGINHSTVYHVPSENECMTCHQSNSVMTPIGPTLRNLNKTVERNGNVLNQISHLQSLGILNTFGVDQVEQIVDYNDLGASIEERGRAYLAMNCSHCHNPNSWERAAEREFDFRYETPLNQTGIFYEEDKIKRAIQDREMPLIGTTILDGKGVNLIIEYLDNL